MVQAPTRGPCPLVSVCGEGASHTYLCVLSLLVLCLFGGNAPRDRVGEVEKCASVRAGQRPQGLQLPGDKKKVSARQKTELLVTVIPTTIGLKAEVTVHAEPITKDSSSPGAGL